MRKSTTSHSVETSIIAKDTQIKGDLDFVGTLIIEGSLESQIKGDEITIQKTGKVNGTMKVRSLNCHGQIEGDIHADNVVIHSDAVITGGIHAITLQIEPGASVNGSISMQAPKTASIKQLSDKLSNAS